MSTPLQPPPAEPLDLDAVEVWLKHPHAYAHLDLLRAVVAECQRLRQKIALIQAAVARPEPAPRWPDIRAAVAEVLRQPVIPDHVRHPVPAPPERRAL